MNLGLLKDVRVDWLVNLSLSLSFSLSLFLSRSLALYLCISSIRQNSLSNIFLH